MASVEARSNGTFRVVWRESGKKRYRTFATKDEAKKFACDPFATRGSQRIGLPPLVEAFMRPRPTPTVVAYGLSLVEDPNLKVSSRDIYRKAFRKVAESDLGEMEVSKVIPADIRAFLTEDLKDRRNVIQLLGKIFNSAVREGIINVSPLKRGDIRRPSVPQKDIQPLTVEEIERLANKAATVSERDALCIRVGGYVGLRGGEVGGLRVRDIDVRECRIHVRQNATTTSVGRKLGELKTKSSRRSLKVACSLAQEIADYTEANPPGDDGLIFKTDQGNLVTSYTLTRATQRAAKRAGMRPVSFHDLRHTCASMLIKSGADVKSVQYYLGHATATLTLDTYARIWPNSDDALAARMEAMRESYRTGTEG